MTTPHTERLMWEGSETVHAATEALRRNEDVELELPGNFHHALFAHMYPDAASGALEDVDMTGGAELIARLAELKGLEPLVELSKEVAKTPAEVYVQSPVPKIIIRFPVSPPAA
ncbi:MAG: hypothetical protein GWO16_01775 [Gammaproteobacteria bacterium]|nr:hypothetical protein [Gammaproteobacteria bacterium]NIR28444.1 hypothetical protein [Gammaproteobacteria bacterium]NIR96890.1 hypothetical protein [Gammaproteobacteria bacterium]NIT62591.1 hypothetical protein [Gammaproteobacteria bacterium]NIV19548.1 hypothetical protein [Gammaproteobacteria bacterium]